MSLAPSFRLAPGWIVALVAIALLAINAMVIASFIHSGSHPLPVAVQQPIWICPTHPEVQRTEPGLCPICRQPLVPAEPAPQPALGLRAPRDGAPAEPDPRPNYPQDDR